MVSQMRNDRGGDGLPVRIGEGSVWAVDFAFDEGEADRLPQKLPAREIQNRPLRNSN